MVVEAARSTDVEHVVREIFRGHILWLLHTRSHFGDSARISVEPWLDISEGEGYIESYAKMGRRFPEVGWATGVSGVPRAQAWLKLREVRWLRRRSGCYPDAGGLGGGEFGTSRMMTRELLSRAGIVDVEKYTSTGNLCSRFFWRC